VAVLEQLVAATNRAPTFLCALAAVLTLGGREEDARAIVAELESRAATEYVPHITRAPIYALLGEMDRAFAMLEAAYDERSPFMWFMASDPAFDPMRTDPRYDEMMRRVGLA
jgi:hypothetical protein